MECLIKAKQREGEICTVDIFAVMMIVNVIHLVVVIAQQIKQIDLMFNFEPFNMFNLYLNFSYKDEIYLILVYFLICIVFIFPCR